MYTINDLKKANAELDEIEKRWAAAYSADCPNPLDAEAKLLAGKVRDIEEDLKRRGIIPYTDHELAEESLDAAFPNAQSKEVVTYNGKRYQRRFYPIEKSKTGKTVRKWRKEWVLLDKD
jgi:hypothetical protein